MIGFRGAPRRRAPRRGDSRRIAAPFFAAIVLVHVLSACSLVGGGQADLKVNLANQRASAVKFIRNQPDVQVIRFTQPGGVDGGGGWSANAVVTIDGKEYQEILGPHFLAGDPLPDTPEGTTSGPVIVQFSDGTSEVVQ